MDIYLDWWKEKRKSEIEVVVVTVLIGFRWIRILDLRFVLRKCFFLESRL